MGSIDIVRLLFNYGAYHFTEHLFAELDNDGFTIYDLECVVANGRIRRSWPKEKKFEVIGKSYDNRLMAFICRITINQKLIIITAYEDKTKK
ncbi:MAG: DUF4258 domain-containing protein [Fibrobacterota bacterium]